MIAQLSWRGWVAGLRALLRGEGILRPSAGTAPELRPIARDVQALLRELEHQFRPTDETQQRWTQDTLRAVLRGEMRGNDVIIVSNREPYIHVKTHGRHPRAASRERPRHRARARDARVLRHVDRARQRQRRPRDGRPATTASRCRPTAPRITLRRLWLTRAARSRATTRASPTKACGRCATSRTCGPLFRAATGSSTAPSTRKFADAVVQEAASDDPVVLVQDYHFALLPRMIRERLPKATIITFWHIPWPNPEAFAICPWRVELLDGLLGSDIVGFHTQFHVNNFLDTRRPLRRGAHRPRDVQRRVRAAAARPCIAIPISIEWPPAPLARARADRRGARARARALQPAARPQDRRRRGPPRLHQGHRRALQRGRAPARARAAVGRQASPSSRSPRLRAATIGDYQELRGARARSASSRDQRALSECARIRRSSCSPSTTSPTPSTSTCARPTCAS